MAIHHDEPDLIRLLTPRQREVLDGVRLGLTNAEIAQRVGLSEAGVRYHVSEIMNKLGVHSRHEAATWPERPPWWSAAGAPLALFWRKAAAALPVKAGTAISAVSGMSFVTVVAGLALIAVLLVRAGGSGGDDTAVDSAMGAAATDAADEGSDTLLVVSSPVPPATVAAVSRPERSPSPSDDDTTTSESPRGTPTPAGVASSEPEETTTTCSPSTCGTAGPPPAPIPGESGGGAMALDCDTTVPGVQRSCWFPGGSTFDVQVHVVEPPTEGYNGFDALTHWSDDLLTYQRGSYDREVLLEHCAAERLLSPPASLYLGCLFAGEYVPNMDSGAAFQFRYHCGQGGDALVELTPPPPGSPFTTFTTLSGTVVPTLAGAAITCGPCPAGGCPPPPTPTATPDPGPTPEPAGSGGLAVDCNAASPGIQGACSYPEGATFSVQVYVTHAPLDGYWAIQAKLRWTDEQLDYLPGDRWDEILSPDCQIPSRAINQPNDPSLLVGCTPFPSGTGLTTTGAVMEFRFACREAGETPLYLVARAGDLQLGSHFLDRNLSPIDPELSPATVTCG